MKTTICILVFAAGCGIAPPAIEPLQPVSDCDVGYLTAVNGCEHARFEASLTDGSPRTYEHLEVLNDCRYSARADLAACYQETSGTDPTPMLCGAQCEYDYRDAEVFLATGRAFPEDFAQQTRATYRTCLAACQGVAP